MLCKCSGKYIDIYFILKITFLFVCGSRLHVEVQVEAKISFQGVVSQARSDCTCFIISINALNLMSPKKSPITPHKVNSNVKSLFLYTLQKYL